MTIDDVWYASSPGARAVRAAVTPLSWLYRAGVAVRNSLYDRGTLRARSAPIPVVSVGNITVGGTGKTPFSAYLVRELRSAGHEPAVVLRGYGDDELYLHARLNPAVAVIAAADRVAGIREAAARGADVAVLDDAFQHRRAARDLDVVLVSAEHWQQSASLLPAGPLREPASSLRRADVIVVTRKSASAATATRLLQELTAKFGGRVAVAVAVLEPVQMLRECGGVGFAAGDASAPGELPTAALRGERVLAVAGIGDPSSFFEQLRQAGAMVTERCFVDHHAYSAQDVARLAMNAADHKYVVTTEKDVVKLSRTWPANGPGLWYLTQAVRFTEGEGVVTAALAKLFQRATSIA